MIMTLIIFQIARQYMSFFVYIFEADMSASVRGNIVWTSMFSITRLIPRPHH